MFVQKTIKVISVVLTLVVNSIWNQKLPRGNRTLLQRVCKRPFYCRSANYDKTRIFRENPLEMFLTPFFERNFHIQGLFTKVHPLIEPNGTEDKQMAHMNPMDLISR